MEANDLERRMNQSLVRLGLGRWSVCWLSDSSCSVRGRVIPEKFLIEIRDDDEGDAWDTLLHEVVELKLRLVTQPYREMCNALIGTIEKLTYTRKEQFISDLPKLLKIYEESIEETNPTTHK